MPYRRVRSPSRSPATCFRPGDPDGVIATGFIAAGPWDFVGHVELREGTVDKEKTRLIDRDDMVSNTLGTFVSLTVGCARCHDHKFDPIPQKDYYRLQAVFAGVDRGDRPLQTPEVVEQRKQLLARQTRLTAERRNGREEDRGADQPGIGPARRRTGEGARRDLAAPVPARAGQPEQRLSQRHHAPARRGRSGCRSTWAPSPPSTKCASFPPGRPISRDSPGFGFPLRFRVEISDEPAFRNPRVLADHTKADFANPGDNPYRILPDGPKGRYVRVTATRLWKRMDDYVFALAEMQVISAGTNVAKGKPVSSLDSIEAGRWSRRYLVDDFDSRHRLPDLSRCEDGPCLSSAPGTRGAAARQGTAARPAGRMRSSPRACDKSLRTSTPSSRRSAPSLAPTCAGPMVYAVQPIPPRPIWVLHRGDVEQRKRARQCRRTGRAFTDPARSSRSPAPEEGGRRAALAEWITDARNGLTWRSIVNRVWHYHFGRGIVDTPSDFGRNGSRPTHPELLDWLAVEFRDGGRSLKKLHRLIVTSAVYRQSSRHDEAAAKVDADNRYLWRMNRRRLDAESLRDAVLSVSGQLDRRMGGPGYEPFRFKDDHSPIYDHDDLKKILDPATYRRTIYRFTVRSVPNPFLDCMDCPDPSLHTPVRNTTLTALQALALLEQPVHGPPGKPVCGSPDGAECGCRSTGGSGLPPDVRPAADGGGAGGRVGVCAKHTLAKACRVLFNANEFVFVD